MKSMRNNELEAQIDVTRIRLYEIIKDMTAEEQAEFFNNRGQEILHRHGLKTKIMPIVQIPERNINTRK